VLEVVQEGGVTVADQGGHQRDPRGVQGTKEDSHSIPPYLVENPIERADAGLLQNNNISGLTNDVFQKGSRTSDIGH
jgi:hypothetical protein